MSKDLTIHPKFLVGDKVSYKIFKDIESNGVKCPVCKGSGLIKVIAADTGVEMEVNCGKCWGTGWEEEPEWTTAEVEVVKLVEDIHVEGTIVENFYFEYLMNGDWLVEELLEDATDKELTDGADVEIEIDMSEEETLLGQIHEEEDSDDVSDSDGLEEEDILNEVEEDEVIE